MYIILLINDVTEFELTFSARNFKQKNLPYTKQIKLLIVLFIIVLITFDNITVLINLTVVGYNLR